MQTSQIFSLIRAAPASALKKVKNTINYTVQLHIYKNQFFIAHKKWCRDRGDETLRPTYPLNKDSVVVDVGGYKGDFADAISKKYDCFIYVFEPVLEYYESCRKKFAGNPKIKCFNFGLSDSDGSFLISDDGDGSSIIRTSADNGKEKVDVREFDSAITSLGISKIDLLKLNIEGGEFVVLPHIIKTSAINRIRFLQVQFHDFIPDAEKNRREIRSKLANTHIESWNYPFVWESWERKL